MTPITYVSEQPTDWSNALAAADSYEKLLRTAEAWQELAGDALETVKAMTPSDFREWRKGFLNERKGKFAGEDFAVKYGNLMMPTLMFKVAIMAIQYQVPWGAMYSRLKETNNLDRALAA